LKTLLVLLALVSPLLAHAEVDESSCVSRDRATAIEVAYYFDGTYENIADNTPVVALVKYTKVAGKTAFTSVKMNGQVNESAKGPYFELKADDGSTLFLSAPASKSPSELKSNGKTLEVFCD
jgi:hypothetical protein